MASVCVAAKSVELLSVGDLMGGIVGERILFDPSLIGCHVGYLVGCGLSLLYLSFCVASLLVLQCGKGEQGRKVSILVPGVE